jgi:hypothetical protein
LVSERLNQPDPRAAWPKIVSNLSPARSALVLANALPEEVAGIAASAIPMPFFGTTPLADFLP